MKLARFAVGELFKQDVLRLDVTVNYMNVVTEVQCQKNLVDHEGDLIVVERPVIVHVLEAVMQTSTSHQFHHYVEV